MIVKIDETKKKRLPFKDLMSRLGTAIVLGYLGFRHQVIPIMQTLSHGTRAFVWSANGLQGFVIRADIMYILNEAKKSGELEEVTKY